MTLLNKLFKKLDGKILCIGINNEKISNIIEKNNKITFCHLLTNESVKSNEKVNDIEINIREISKKYKNLDYLIVDLNKTQKYLKYFYKYISVLSSKKKIFYTNNKNIANKLVNRANLYKYKIKIKEENNNYLVIIDTPNKHYIKAYILYCMDNLSNEIDKIAEILTN